MSYPDYPDNRLIVNGVDLSERFGMILADGYTLTPPSPKTYTVDIPGGNGKLDLTESLLGDTAYDNRQQEFDFYVIDPADFERTKTEISNFLHGKAFDYVLTMDPYYTYHGRFEVGEYKHSSYSNALVGAIKIKIDANPFKMKNRQVYRIDALGGRIVYLTSGRMRVRPTIESEGFIKVIYKGKLLILPAGSWSINDLLFEDGVNELYLNTYDIRNLKWGDLKTGSITWSEFRTKKLYEWYKSNGDRTYVIKTWSDLSDKTWSDLSEEKWVDQTYLKDADADVKPVYIEYDWGDL